MSSGEDRTDELPKWACPDCGEIFRGITQDSVDKKAADHQEGCNGRDTPEEPHPDKEDARYRPSVTPPRNPDAYLMSEHFHSMMTRREEPEATSEVINQTLQSGHINGTHVSGRFIVEHHVDGWRWWIIVQMVDEAFADPSEKHLAVTLYAPDSESHKRVKKYV